MCERRLAMASIMALKVDLRSSSRIERMSEPASALALSVPSAPIFANMLGAALSACGSDMCLDMLGECLCSEMWACVGMCAGMCRHVCGHV